LYTTTRVCLEYFLVALAPYALGILATLFTEAVFLSPDEMN